MKTDDRATRQRNEAEGEEAKVVRLSDWLAADDELVPIGPRAHAASRESASRPADPDAEPPAAAGFWDGDTSVHAAVPGPEIFDEPGDRTNGRRRYRRPSSIWRPALTVHPMGCVSRLREAVADLVDWISWPWAAGGLAFLSVVVVVLVTTLGGSPGHHQVAAEAGIGDQSRTALSATLGELDTAARSAAAADLRALPHVDTAGRTIGASAGGAQALHARHRSHAVATSASGQNPSAAGSVDTTATAPSEATPAPTETTPAPTETEPVQTTPAPAPSTGAGGGSSSSGGSSTGSPKQSAFGASGSLGPGSSPNG